MYNSFHKEDNVWVNSLKMKEGQHITCLIHFEVTVYFSRLQEKYSHPTIVILVRYQTGQHMLNTFALNVRRDSV